MECSLRSDSLEADPEISIWVHDMKERLPGKASKGAEEGEEKRSGVQARCHLRQSPAISGSISLIPGGLAYCLDYCSFVV